MSYRLVNVDLVWTAFAHFLVLRAMTKMVCLRTCHLREVVSAEQELAPLPAPETSRLGCTATVVWACAQHTQFLRAQLMTGQDQTMEVVRAG